MIMRRAFSLLEVLLAMALLALLAGGIFGFLWNIMDRRDALLRASGEAQAAGAFFDLLEADLACAIAGDRVLGAGVAGDAAQLRLMSRRVWAPATARERDAAMGDLQVSEYQFDGGRLLVQRRPVETGSEAEAGASGPEVIGEGIGAMRIRYFDGSSWITVFDSLERSSLPVAVEVAVWFGRGGDEVVTAEEGGSEETEYPQRSPDRIRVIAIADGPTTAWKEVR